MNAQDNSAGKTIAIVTAVIGGVALVGTGTTAAFASTHALTRSDETVTVDVDGVRSLDADVAAGVVSIRFDDVSEAQLIVTGANGGRWTLERDEDELVLRDRDSWFGWDFDDWSWFGGASGQERVDLILPESLAGLDAELDLGAGSLDVEGDFGEFDVDVAAGALTVSGSATSIDASQSAGRAEFRIADASEVSFDIAAGRLEAEFTGTAPREVELDVSAGIVDLTLPDVAYRVSQEVSAGSLDNQLQTRSDARNSVVVSLSAGTATLRAAD